MNQLPRWAIKPQHHKKVIPTSRGWEVEGTGEILTRVRGLDEKLKALFQEADDLRKSVEEPAKTVEPSSEEKVEPKTTSSEETPKPRKRRGRPPKKKTADAE